MIDVLDLQKSKKVVSELFRFVGSLFGGVDRSETRLGFHLKVKFQSLSVWIYFLLILCIVLGVFWRDG